MLQLTAALVSLGLAVLALQQTSLVPTGTLRAAFLASNPVQGRLDPVSGEVTGPAGDLARELARRLGVTARIQPAADAAAVIELVRSRQVDFGFLAIEAARAEQVDFTAPYALMGSTYLVRADGPLMRSADVDRAGLTIGAVKGQSQEIYVSEHVRNARIVTFPVVPPPDAVAKLVLDKRVDAFAANRQRLEAIAQSTPGLRVVADNFMVNGQALVVPKGAIAALAELNRFVVDVLTSGFVKMSLDRNGAAGVEVAPLPR